MRILENVTTEYPLSNDGSTASVRLNDVQQALVDAIRNHTELDCLQNNTDTYLLQELSPIRQNLLDWISFSSNKTVLELGGKTGILTELLCKRCGMVTSVVASESDAYVNAARNGNWENLQIRLCVEENGQDNWDDKANSFNIVTLIGADVELCQGIFSNENTTFTDAPTSQSKSIDDAANNHCSQYMRLLALAHDYLKPHGRLILAVNNRLGIQYWSGKTDICSPALFSSVQGDTEGQAEYCFAKKQLSSMLKKTGFEALQFYYPVPDYRYPTQIFSDDYLPQVGDIRPTSAHYDDIRYQLFDEKKAFDSLCEDGLFDVFANSFLVLCSKGGE